VLFVIIFGTLPFTTDRQTDRQTKPQLLIAKQPNTATTQRPQHLHVFHIIITIKEHIKYGH